jgi:hypothetical protein
MKSKVASLAVFRGTVSVPSTSNMAIVFGFNGAISRPNNPRRFQKRERERERTRTRPALLCRDFDPGKRRGDFCLLLVVSNKGICSFFFQKQKEETFDFFLALRGAASRLLESHT